jgi:uncharacterized protein DUF4406
MTRLYLAGPMRRIKEFNFPAFFAAEDQLIDAGYETFNPARHDDSAGYPWRRATGRENPPGFPINKLLLTDLKYICLRAEGVALLPGWEESRGVMAEISTAAALGLPVQTVERWLVEAEEEKRYAS